MGGTARSSLDADDSTRSLTGIRGKKAGGLVAKNARLSPGLTLVGSFELPSSELLFPIPESQIPTGEGDALMQLDEGQRLVAQTVREFVDREVIPVASRMEHADEYPDQLVETMKTLGLFGLNIPDEYGGTEVDYTTFAIVFEELARGWMGLAGILGTHLVLSDVLLRYGTAEQKQRYLPRLARGELRGGICLSEPGAGTDLQAITTRAERDGDTYHVDGSKMWVTNGRRAQVFLLMAKTDPDKMVKVQVASDIK